MFALLLLAAVKAHCNHAVLYAKQAQNAQLQGVLPACMHACHSSEHELLYPQARLAGLTTEFNSTAQSANRLLGSLMNRAKGTTSSAISPEAPQAQPQLAPDSLQKPSRRSDVPPSLQKRSNLPASLQKAQKQQEELTAAAATAADSSRDQARASRAGRGLPQSSRVEAEQARPAKRKLSRRTPEKQEEPPATTQSAQSTAASRPGCWIL